jgi:hypothetical protein
MSKLSCGTSDGKMNKGKRSERLIMSQLLTLKDRLEAEAVRRNDLMMHLSKKTLSS